MTKLSIFKAVLAISAVATLSACAESPEACHDCDDTHPITSSRRGPSSADPYTFTAIQSNEAATKVIIKLPNAKTTIQGQYSGPRSINPFRPVPK